MKKNLELDMKRARQHLNPFGQMMTPGAFDGEFNALVSLF